MDVGELGSDRQCGFGNPGGIQPEVGIVSALVLVLIVRFSLVPAERDGVNQFTDLEHPGSVGCR